MNELKNKIHMENELIKLYNKIEKPLKDFFKQYKNKKIFKKDGILIKEITENEKFKELLNEKNYKVKPLKNGNATINFIFISKSVYSVLLKIQICFVGGNYEDKTYYCQYIDKYFYIGVVKAINFKGSDILESVTETENLKLINYNKEKSLLNKRVKLLKEIETINNKLHYTLKNLKYNEYTKEYY